MCDCRMRDFLVVVALLAFFACGMLMGIEVERRKEVWHMERVPYHGAIEV